MTGYVVTDIPTFVAGSLLPPAVFDVRQFFVSRGIRAYLVGGAVRDALLGRKTDDLDVAVESTGPGLLELAQNLADVLEGRYVLLHHEMGAARVVLPNGPVIDLIAAPDGIAQDLGRRDFTVNAMAVSLDEMVSSDRWHRRYRPP